jgi:hypothetical protein
MNSVLKDGAMKDLETWCELLYGYVDKMVLQGWRKEA